MDSRTRSPCRIIRAPDHVLNEPVVDFVRHHSPFTVLQFQQIAQQISSACSFCMASLCCVMSDANNTKPGRPAMHLHRADPHQLPRRLSEPSHETALPASPRGSSPAPTRWPAERLVALRRHEIVNPAGASPGSRAAGPPHDSLPGSAPSVSRNRIRSDHRVQRSTRAANLRSDSATATEATQPAILPCIPRRSGLT